MCKKVLPPSIDSNLSVANRNPEFSAGEPIEVLLLGHSVPLQLTFEKWVPKDDQPMSSFLFAREPDGFLRVVNDFSIAKISPATNGEVNLG